MKRRLCRIAMAGLVLLLLPSLCVAEVPQVGRVQGLGDTVTVWGSGFNKGKVEVLGWSAAVKNDTFAKEALAALADGSWKNLLPAQPEKGARGLTVVSQDPRGLTMALNTASRGREVIWVKNEDGFSRPFITGKAQPWFVYPQRAVAGQEIRLFGRDLRKQYRPLALALRPAGGGAPTELAADGRVRNLPYEIKFDLPADLKPGDYDILVNNSFGGAAGWSEPVRVTVQAAVQSKVLPVFNVMESGAKGDGMHDDSQAILAALSKAAAAGGGTVYLPAGIYGLSRTLELPAGVGLRGAGMSNTVIRVLEGSPMQGGFPAKAKIDGYASDWITYWARSGQRKVPMIWMRDRCAVRDLHLDLGESSDVLGILVAKSPGTAEDLKIENTRFTAPSSTYNIIIMGETYGLTIRHNDFTGVALTAIANRHEQLYIGYNTVKARQHGFPLQECNLVFLRGTIRSIIEENDIRDGDRNLCFQAGRRWGNGDIPQGMQNSGRGSYHTVVMGNKYTNNIPRRHNAGELMYEGGGIFWHGKADAHTATGMTVKSGPFNSDLVDNYVTVLDGTGIGQYRKIVKNDGNTLTLERPWDVMPDTSSHMAVGNFLVEHLWLDNTEEHIAGWSGFWGGHLGHVISGDINRDGAGLYLWAYSDKSVVAFVDVVGNWISNRGNIDLRGPGLVFGNTIYMNEVHDFRFRPSQHGTTGWAHPRDSNVLEARRDLVEQAGVQIASPKISPEFPATTPGHDWNIVEKNLLLNGRVGISIEPGARYNILNRNVIEVDEQSVADGGENTLLGQQFDGQ